MTYEQNKSDVRLAYILSAIWPGMGIMYLSKKGIGMIFVIIHVLSVLWLLKTLYSYIFTPDYDINYDLRLLFAVLIIVFNWIASMLKTNANETKN